MEAKITLVVVAYNREDSVRRVLYSISRAHYSYENIRLIVSIDHSGNEAVVQTAEEFEWKYGEKIVIYHPKRLGLRKHIIFCGDLARQYGAVMVLEDDLYVSPDYYDFAMQALEKYGEHPRIAGIALNTKRELLESVYPFFPLRKGEDVYFQQFATSWGQVWNDRTWNGFRKWYDEHPQLPYNKNVLREVLDYPETSWAKFFQTYIVETGKYFVYSYDSLTTNFGDAGQHFAVGASSAQSVLFYGKKFYRMPEFENGIKYDIYGEPVGLWKCFGIAEEEFTCDMWGRKEKEVYRRYVLSSRVLGYKVLKSFGMQMKPIELNVLENIEGTELFLYDTTESENSKKENRKEEHFRLLEYGYGVLNGRDLMIWALKKLKRKIGR